MTEKDMKSLVGDFDNKIMEHIIQMHLIGVKNPQTIKDSFKAINTLNILRFSDNGFAFNRAVAAGFLSERVLNLLCINEDDISFPLETVPEKVKDKFRDMDAENRAKVLNEVILRKYSLIWDRVSLKKRFKIWLFFELYNREISI